MVFLGNDQAWFNYLVHTRNLADARALNPYVRRNPRPVSAWAYALGRATGRAGKGDWLISHFCGRPGDDNKPGKMERFIRNHAPFRDNGLLEALERVTGAADV